MSKLAFSGFLLLILIGFVVYTASFEFIKVGDNENEVTIQNTARNAMTQSINWGSARVNEEITINEEIAKEAVLREYANSISFNSGDHYINIYQLSNKPPLLAVESYSEIATPFNQFVKNFSDNKNNDSSETVTRSREVIIYEAKKTEK